MSNHYPKYMTALSIIILLLLLRFPVFDTGSSTYVYNQTQTEPKSAQDRPINSLRDLNNALVGIAENATPAVVTVNTAQTVRYQQRSPFDMFGPEFFGPFRDFFQQDPFQQRQQPREREFRREGLGSGFIVSSDGYILTNNHVIANAEEIYIGLENGDTLNAEVVGRDADTDIAVLKVDAQNLPFLRLGDSDELRVGEMVMAIGSPLGRDLAHSVSQGIVSGTGRSLDLITFEDFIQTDAAINRGNSGGPLVNMDGEVIGINTAIASQTGGFQGIGFAIPSNIANRIMESIIETGTVVRGFIGVQYRPVDESLARAFGLEEVTGILVDDVVPDGPAQQAGLQSGDVITELNGGRIDDANVFMFNVAAMQPGDEVELTYIRDGERNTVTITLDRRPTDDPVAAVEDSIEDITGFNVMDLTDELAQRLRVDPAIEGVVVESIEENTSAYRNNLRRGDVIVAFGANRIPVTSVDEFRSLVAAHPAGEIMVLQVVRQNTRFFVTFEPRS